MGISATIFAEVTFPPGAVEKWRKLEVDGSFDYGECQFFDSPNEPISVDGILEAVNDRGGRMAVPSDHISLELTPKRLSLRARINESDHHYWGPLLVSMVRMGARVGASGEYALMTEEGDAERLVVTPSSVRAETFDVADLDELDTKLDYEKLFDEASRGPKKKRGGRPGVG